jgi:integrase
MHTEANSAPRLREKVDGERGIYKRHTKDGQTRYEVAVFANGRQSWRTVATLREAKQLRADLVSKAGRGEQVARSRLTLNEVADRWLDSQRTRLRPRTHELYATRLRVHLRPRYGTRKLDTIKVDEVAALIGDLQAEGLSPYTVRGILIVLGRVFSSAVRTGLVKVNPVRQLEVGERPRTERRSFPELDHAAVASLISATPQRYRTLVALSVFTGLRQSEALGLTWGDVDLREGTLLIRQQLDRDGRLVELKTEAALRDVPLAPFLVLMLREHKEAAFARGLARPTDFLFAAETGGPLRHRNVVRRGLDKAIDAAGVPRLRWHDLRHIAASVMINEGADVAYVSRVLGHSSITVTLSIYGHLFAKQKHANTLRERMEAAFGGIFGS